MKSWLARNSQRWLVIVDNADDPQRDYSAYIPSGMSGDVLFTTRVSECETYNTVGSEKLNDLEPELARELLYRAADIPKNRWKEEEKAATDILTILGSHTLAIIQAGAFIKKGLCSLEQYPDVFKRQKGKLLKFHAKQNLSTYGNVYATFEVSVEYLQKFASTEASDALDLLHVIAFMHNSGISETMFQRASEYASKLGNSKPNGGDESLWSLVSHIARLPKYVQGWTGFEDRIRWREACTALENLSIITVHKNDDSFAISMHSLIHAWAKERQDLRSQGRAWQAAATIVALSCEDCWDFDSILLAIQPHVRACVNSEIEDYTCTLSDMEAAQICFQLAHVLYIKKDYRSLDTLVKRIRLRLRDKFDNDHEVAREIKSITGIIYTDQGRYGEAVAVYQDIIESCSRTLPDDDPERLTVQRELALAYQSNQQFEKAVQLFEHIVMVEERLGEDRSDRFNSQHALNFAYRENGQIEKAVQLLDHIVKVEKNLVKDRANRLDSQDELAQLYFHNGHITEAIKLLEYVVKIRETSQVEDHPERLHSQLELARLYQENGQVTKAIQLFEYVVKIKQKSLAEDHPDRLDSQHELAYSYHANGQITKAIQLLEYVAKIKETSLAENHPGRIRSQYQLAISYRKDGQLTKAIALLEHVLVIQKTTLGEDHSERLISEQDLAFCYSKAGQFTKAIALLEHVLSVQKRTLAEDHPDQLISQQMLALRYTESGQFTKAIALFEHVVSVQTTTLAEDDYKRLASQNALTCAYRQNGQLDDALRVERMFNSGT